MTLAHDIPIFINNFNNLDRGFRRLLTWLRDAGYGNVTVIDNASTWPSLLEFYTQSPEPMVVHAGANLGPYALWTLGLVPQSTPFVVTDPDVVPSVTCPYDLVGRLLEALETLPASPCKVGPSIRVDNLPDHYKHKREVVAWEQQFWQRPVDGLGAYESLIDTTFALYLAGSVPWPAEGTHYRLAPPYCVEHVPWYEDSDKSNSEREYYQANARRDFIHW